MKRKNIVYIVIELNKESVPKIIDVFSKKEDAEKEAYKSGTAWRNVIEKEVK